MTRQTQPHILIVDDEPICKSFSAILRSEGYRTTTVSTGRRAMKEMEKRVFDLVLLDIKLPDMDGIQLLERLQETAPETIKIMITGYPSFENAVRSLNLGAESYIMKPVNPAELTKTIRNKLEAKQRAKNITRRKLAEWVRKQVSGKRSSSFQNFLQDVGDELAGFGLTKNQAKTYITVAALGIASASEIAALSKIRREQVYRTIPQLEEHGIVTRRLGKPQKFSAVPPEEAVQLLIETKLKNVKREIDELKQKQADLISKLKRIELPIRQQGISMDVFSSKDLDSRLENITRKAKQRIDVILQFENLRHIYLNHSENLKKELPKTTKIRMITERHEPNTFIDEIKQFAEGCTSQIQLRQVEKLQFNLIIVDDHQAIWGQFHQKNQNEQNLWTDDPTQIAILKTSFENLWNSSEEANAGADKSGQVSK